MSTHMNVGQALAAGFEDPIFGSQKTFRQIMDGLSSPARPVVFSTEALRCGPLSATTTSILLTIVDHDTPLWLDHGLAQSEEVRAFIAFHCGAPLVQEPRDALFGVACDPPSMPPLSAFAQGDPEYPDRSATIILQSEPRENGLWSFSGPGLELPLKFDFAPAPSNFAEQWRANRARFPLGVDVIVAGASRIAGLPRSLELHTS